MTVKRTKPSVEVGDHSVMMCEKPGCEKWEGVKLYIDTPYCPEHHPLSHQARQKAERPAYPRTDGGPSLNEYLESKGER